MSIPSVPTDNLYKFIAFAGLVGVVTAVVLMVSQLGKYVDEQTELNAAWVEAYIALEGNDEARKILTEARDKSLSDQKAELFYEDVKAVEGVEDESMPAVLDFQSKTIQYASLYKVKTQAMSWTLWLGIVSLIVMCAGFVLWYRRLQRHLDKTAEQSVESKDIFE